MSFPIQFITFYIKLQTRVVMATGLWDSMLHVRNIAFSKNTQKVKKTSFGMQIFKECPLCQTMVSTKTEIDINLSFSWFRVNQLFIDILCFARYFFRTLEVNSDSDFFFIQNIHKILTSILNLLCRASKKYIPWKLPVIYTLFIVHWLLHPYAFCLAEVSASSEQRHILKSERNTLC